MTTNPSVNILVNVRCLGFEGAAMVCTYMCVIEPLYLWWGSYRYSHFCLIVYEGEEHCSFNVLRTVCTEIFAVLNFCGFSGKSGHLQRFNPSLTS